MAAGATHPAGAGLSRKLTVSWSRPTRSYIANQGRGGPNRRLPFEPGFGAKKTAPRLAVIVDVSGSVDFLFSFSWVRRVVIRLLAGPLRVILDIMPKYLESGGCCPYVSTKSPGKNGRPRAGVALPSLNYLNIKGWSNNWNMGSNGMWV